MVDKLADLKTQKIHSQDKKPALLTKASQQGHHAQRSTKNKAPNKGIASFYPHDISHAYSTASGFKNTSHKNWEILNKDLLGSQDTSDSNFSHHRGLAKHIGNADNYAS